MFTITGWEVSITDKTAITVSSLIKYLLNICSGLSSNYAVSCIEDFVPKRLSGTLNNFLLLVKVNGTIHHHAKL